MISWTTNDVQNWIEQVAEDILLSRGEQAALSEFLLGTTGEALWEMGQQGGFSRAVEDNILEVPLYMAEEIEAAIVRWDASSDDGDDSWSDDNTMVYPQP